MINLLLYALIATILYLIFKKDEKSWYVERDDFMIEVDPLSGGFVLVEKK